MILIEENENLASRATLHQPDQAVTDDLGQKVEPALQQRLLLWPDLPRQ